MAWEVTPTVRVRLDVPDDRKRDLHATNSKFQYCANHTAEWVWRSPDEDCVTSKSEAETALFDDLREETDSLHANLVQKAIKPATDDIDTCVDRLAEGENTSRPEYDTFSIVYDKRAATYSRDKVSLATVNGSVECAYDLPDVPERTPHGEYLLNEEHSFATSTVHYDSDADEFTLLAQAGSSAMPTISTTSAASSRNAAPTSNRRAREVPTLPISASGEGSDAGAKTIFTSVRKTSSRKPSATAVPTSRLRI